MKRLSVMMVAVMALAVLVAATAFSEDKLVVKDSGGTNTVFAVEDGTSTPNRILRVIGGVPIMQSTPTAGFDFKNTAATFGASIIVGPSGNPNLYANWLATTNAREDATKPSLAVRLDVANDRFRLMRWAVGSSTGTDLFDVNANGSISSSTGASLTAGGTWTNGSSRDYKENISAISAEEAVVTLAALTPVKFNYKVDKDEKHVGFIAEDVPELVAMKDRKSLSPMDIVAVLTKVVQELKTENEGLKAKNDSLENRLLAIEEAIKASK
jgi:hypothetical protein